MLNPTDEIKQRLDLVDLIGEYVKLKPAGSNLRALCPFHNEKTPSFMVSPEKQIWHCFGCGKGGDHFTFIQELEGLEFPEALRVLARRAGVKLTYQNPEFHNRKTRLLDLCRAVADYWHGLLTDDQSAGFVRKYLAERKIIPETINDFYLGYAKNDWADAIKYLQSKDYTLKEIADAGLLVPGQQDRPYDRFRNRLMFPIRDVHGNTVGFTSRKMSEDDPGGKYVNSPQTQIYNKSQILYNLDLAKQEIKRLNYAILVEGNIDAIASYQAGIKNVVAVSGTSLTDEQIKLLKRYTLNVMIAFDADVAGTKANLRGIDLAWQAGLNVKVIHLPEGQDPDDLIREAKDKWKELVKSAENFMDYIFAVTFKNLDLSRVDHKKQAAKKILAVVAKMGDEVERSHYLKKLADKLSVSEEALIKSLPRAKTEDGRPEIEEQKTASVKVDKAQIVAEQLLALLIKFPEQIQAVGQRLIPEMLTYLPAGELYKDLIIYYNKGQSFSFDDFKKALNQDRADYLNQLSLLVDETFYEDQPDLISQEMVQLVGRLTEFYKKIKVKIIVEQIAQAEKAGDGEAANRLSEELGKLSRI